MAEPRESAQLFAQQFQKMFTEEDLINLPALPLHSRSYREITTVHFTKDKVIKALNLMKTDSSPGPDDISTVFLQRTQNTIADVLSKALNSIMESGILPKEWKSAYVMPATTDQ